MDADIGTDIILADYPQLYLEPDEIVSFKKTTDTENIRGLNICADTLREATLNVCNGIAMNKISELLDKPFPTYPLEEQFEIKQLGRPLPDMGILKIQTASGGTKGRTRKFNRNIYLKNNWLCGCDEKHAFFCFPCVLFGGDVMWSKNGVTDLVHIWEKIRTHEKSTGHISNIFSLSLVGKSNILMQLNSTYRQRMAAHNRQVDKNRYVLNLIINGIRFCDALELALQGHDKTDESENKAVCRELVDFSFHLDKDLKDHFGKSSVFEGTSKTTQNVLLTCMLDVYHEQVAEEIKKADYVAVIVDEDETADVYRKFRLAIILRYIVSGRPVERFWNFVYSAGRDAVSISDCIFKEIEPLIGDTPKKLIAQSYDGASGCLSAVQKIIQKKYSLANYVHCYSHQANLIMRSVAAVNPSVRIFFAHVSGLCSFFSTSPHRTRLLEEVVQKSLPQSSWNSNSQGVNTIYEYRTKFIRVLESLEINERLNSVVEQAGSYKLRLKDNDFIFWLTVLRKIMPHVDIIFDQLQTATDPAKIKRNFANEMQRIRDYMDIILAELDSKFLEGEKLPQKKPRTCAPTNRKSEALEICDSITQQIKTRLSFTGHLVATNLFVVQNFKRYRAKFPDHFLNESVSVYPFLERSKLKTELQVLYDREELRDISGAVSLLSLLLQDGICDTFHETLKLLKVLVTVPMPTSEVERCFSTSKIVKTFLRNSVKEESLSALGMLSVEKVFLNNIENFNKRVIELFAYKEEHRMDFIYLGT